jgi:outer membrane protein
MWRLLLLFLIISVSANAQPWTLQQCIERALQYNIQVRQSSLANESNNIDVTQNKLKMLPNLNGDATQNYFRGRSIDPYTNLYTTQDVRSNNFQLTTNMTLFEGLQLQNTLKESKLNYIASQNDLRKIQNDISINVVNYYLQVLYNEELLITTRDQYDASVIQRNRTKRMYEIGSVNKGAYLDLESQLASDEVKFIEAQSAFDQALLSLTQLLELDTMKNFTIVKPEVVVPLFDSTMTNTEEIFLTAMGNQPDVKSAQYKVYSAEKGVSIAKGAHYPRLLVGASLATNYSTSSKNAVTDPFNLNPRLIGISSGGDSVYTYVPSTTLVDVPFSDQWTNNLGKSVGFTLQIPIFNGWSTRTNIQKAKLNLEKSKLDNELTKKNLYKSVQQAVADLNASYKKYLASERSTAAMEEAYNFNKQKLDLGSINTYDYLLSKNNLANAQATSLQAKYDYIFRSKIIDFYLGKPLAF